MAIVVKHGYKFNGFVHDGGKKVRKLFVGGDTVPEASLPKSWKTTFKDVFVAEAEDNEKKVAPKGDPKGKGS